MLFPSLSPCQFFTSWMLRSRLALKAPSSMPSYCGFLQPAAHPLPPLMSHPSPLPRGFDCALLLSLLPWFAPPLEQAGATCLCLQPLHLKAKAFSWHPSTCDAHLCPVLCEEPRESLILCCCQHLSLAQICHIAEVSLSLL